MLYWFGLICLINKGKIMAWLYLFISIVAEVIATSMLKLSNEFTRLGPSIIVVLGYGTAF